MRFHNSKNEALSEILRIVLNSILYLQNDYLHRKSRKSGDEQ